MGRGPRGEQALTNSLVTRSQRPVNHLAQEITALCDAIDILPEGELEKINLLVQTSKDGPTKTAGRGDRLAIAVSDLYEAETLSQSANKADQLIAEAMLDNALVHLGRIISLGDEQSPAISKIASAIKEHETARGLNQISDLEKTGLIDSLTAGQLRDNIYDLQQEAFASSSRSPRWLGVPLMHKAQKSLVSLTSSRSQIDDDSPLALVVDKSIQDCQKVIKQSQKWLKDPAKGGNLRLNGPGQIIRAQTLVAACEDRHTRQANSQIPQIAAAHQQFVAEQLGETVPDRPMVAVSDSRWLDLSMNYQRTVSGRTSSTIALESGGGPVLLSPSAAESVLSAADGEMSSTLVHEIIHTTQKAPVAVLPDQKPLTKGQRYDQHRTFESALCEGATQALTNQIVATTRPVSAEEEAYPVYVALCESVCQKYCVGEEEQFYRELSKTATGARTAFLASKIDKTSASEERQRQLVSVLLPICESDDFLDFEEVKSRFESALRTI